MKKVAFLISCGIVSGSSFYYDEQIITSTDFVVTQKSTQRPPLNSTIAQTLLGLKTVVQEDQPLNSWDEEDDFSDTDYSSDEDDPASVASSIDSITGEELSFFRNSIIRARAPTVDDPPSPLRRGRLNWEGVLEINIPPAPAENRPFDPPHYFTEPSTPSPASITGFFTPFENEEGMVAAIGPAAHPRLLVRNRKTKNQEEEDTYFQNLMIACSLLQQAKVLSPAPPSDMSPQEIIAMLNQGDTSKLNVRYEKCLARGIDERHKIERVIQQAHLMRHKPAVMVPLLLSTAGDNKPESWPPALYSRFLQWLENYKRRVFERALIFPTQYLAHMYQAEGSEMANELGCLLEDNLSTLRNVYAAALQTHGIDVGWEVDLTNADPLVFVDFEQVFNLARPLELTMMRFKSVKRLATVEADAWDLYKKSGGPRREPICEIPPGLIAQPPFIKETKDTLIFADCMDIRDFPPYMDEDFKNGKELTTLTMLYYTHLLFDHDLMRDLRPHFERGIHTFLRYFTPDALRKAVGPFFNTLLEEKNKDVKALLDSNGINPEEDLSHQSVQTLLEMV